MVWRGVMHCIVFVGLRYGISYGVLCVCSEFPTAGVLMCVCSEFPTAGVLSTAKPRNPYPQTSSLKSFFVCYAALDRALVQHR